MYSRANLKKEGYTEGQIEEITAGVKSGIDVSKYKLIDMAAEQMREIRLGLEEGLNVDVYAHSEFDWLQMMEIRKGLVNGVNAKLYAIPKCSYDKMREIRKGLEDGYTLVMYLQYDAGVIREIRKALEENLDIKKYVNDGYDEEQLSVIRECLRNDVDVREYVTNVFRGDAIREICKGVRMGLDVSIYAKDDFSWQQMREIRKGLASRIDVSRYTNKYYSWQQMREIRKGLEKGLDVSSYSSLMYTPREMRKARKKIWDGVLEVNEKNYVHENDEGLQITVSADEMEAYIKIKESMKSVYSVEDIIDELKKYGIIEGVSKKRICEAFDNVGTSILVAEGREPQEGKDGYNEYMFNPNFSRQPKILEDGSVDYANTEWFQCVKEGDVIAKYHEATEGKPGITVKGKTIPSNNGKEQAIHETIGCKLSDDQREYIATVTGKVEIIRNRLIVTSMFEIPEVNPSIGNVKFSGDVYIKGNVASGSLIEATGDVIVCGFVEGAEIRAGGNIEIKLGVNASGKGCIEAKGNIHSKYFENAIIRAEKNVEANNILNSDVRAGGKIIINGKKSTITGGKAYAFEGIEAQNLGNQARMNTVIMLGVDEELMDKYNKAIAKIADIKKEMDILTNAYEDIQRKHPPEVRNVMDMFLKIEKALGVKTGHYIAAKQEKEVIKKEIEKARNAKAIVKGDVYEGVVVHIDNSTWRSPGVRNVTIEKKIDKSTVSIIRK